MSIKYTVCKNKMNDHQYIVFKYKGIYYKALQFSDLDLWLWVDKSAFSGECYNLQLLKTFKNDQVCTFDEIYKTVLEWLTNETT